MDPEQAKKEAAWALELTGLSGKEKENPYDLELYERKMTAIASVLAMDTDVLILDEPTIAQDRAADHWQHYPQPFWAGQAGHSYSSRYGLCGREF